MISVVNPRARRRKMSFGRMEDRGISACGMTILFVCVRVLYQECRKVKEF